MVASDRALRFGSWTTACRRSCAAMNDGVPRVETMTRPAGAGGDRRPAPARREPRRRGQRRRPFDSRPGGDVPVRIYRPHGDGESRPRWCSPTAAGSCSATWTHTTASAGRCRGTPSRSSCRWTTGWRRSIGRLRPPRMCSRRWCWVIAHADELGIDPSRVLIAGDSAGGNLAAVTALMCREQRRAHARRAGADLSGDRAVLRHRELSRYSTGYVNTRDAMQCYWRQYLDDRMPSPEYLVAPARAESHEGLPPAVVVTAGFDVLLSEGVSYAQRLRAANVPVVHRDYPGLFHGFVTIMPFAARGLGPRTAVVRYAAAARGTKVKASA